MKELSKTEIFFKKKKHVLVLTLLSTQHATTYIKKVIEDNSTMEETIRFLAVRVWLMHAHVHVCISKFILIPFYSSVAGRIGHSQW